MRLKVFVVDYDIEQINTIKKYFDGNDKIEIVSSALDGKEAINILKNKSTSFDIMILEIVLPIIDGVGILKYMNEQNISKDVIVLTSFKEEETIRITGEYGARYYILKPFDMERLEDILLSLSKSINSKKELYELQDKGIQIKLTNLLHALGIPANIKGYQYVRSGILMVYDNPSFIGNITKGLYPGLSNKYNTSTSKVERSIRHAIEISCIRGDIDLMEEIFGHSVDVDKAKPTNSEFIVTIADKLRLDMINIK